MFVLPMVDATQGMSCLTRNNTPSSFIHSVGTLCSLRLCPSAGEDAARASLRITSNPRSYPMRIRWSYALALSLLPAAVGAAPAQKGLDFYFVDVEGGAATLIVTPAGESVLIDCGAPGDRDASRIAHVAKDVAHLKR